MARPLYCEVCQTEGSEEIIARITNAGPKGLVKILAESGYSWSAYQVKKHIRRCMNEHWATLRRSGHVAHVDAVQQQFMDWLDEVHDLYEAAKDVLLVDGEVNLNVREHEVSIVYEDHNDRNEKTGEPKLKTGLLANLNAKLADHGFIVKHSYIKAEDARKTIRELISQAESLLDKLAKVTGAYSKERSNDADLTQELSKLLMKVSQTLGTSYQEEARLYLDAKGDKLTPDLRKWLTEQAEGGMPALRSPVSSAPLAAGTGEVLLLSGTGSSVDGDLAKPIEKNLGENDSPEHGENIGE